MALAQRIREHLMPDSTDSDAALLAVVEKCEQEWPEQSGIGLPAGWLRASEIEQVIARALGIDTGD